MSENKNFCTDSKLIVLQSYTMYVSNKLIDCKYRKFGYTIEAKFLSLFLNLGIIMQFTTFIVMSKT